jgi:hypothetical protein
LFKIREPVHLALWTVGFSAVETLQAVAARSLQEAPSYVVALLKCKDSWASAVDDADTFVAEDHLRRIRLERVEKGENSEERRASLPLKPRSPPHRPDAVIETKTWFPVRGERDVWVSVMEPSLEPLKTVKMMDSWDVMLTVTRCRLL